MADAPKKWYDDANVAEMHEDLALHYQRTLPILLDRPRLRKHFESCKVCQQIKAEHEGKAAVPPGARKRIKYVLRPADMHRLLQLPPGHEIVFMYATMDPNTIQVILAGENLPDAPDAAETPIAGAELPWAA